MEDWYEEVAEQRHHEARMAKRAKWQALLGSAEECERLLKFAFEDGALPKETIAGLCLDPYGVLRDLRLSIQGVKPT